MSNLAIWELSSFVQLPVMWLLFWKFGKVDVLRSMVAEAVVGCFIEFCVLSASLRKPVPIGISFLPAAAEPMFGRSSTAARSPIC
jgi:hypothetical protein